MIGNSCKYDFASCLSTKKDRDPQMCIKFQIFYFLVRAFWFFPLMQALRSRLTKNFKVIVAIHVPCAFDCDVKQHPASEDAL